MTFSPRASRSSVAGSRILVTGASAGIGAALARRCADVGAQVVWSGSDADRLRAVAGAGAEIVAADLRYPGAVEHVAQAAGSVDIVVANAGIGWAGDMSTMDRGHAAELVCVNLAAPMALCREVLPGMYRRGHGHLVLVSSIAALGVRDEAVYAATKAGLRAFGESLRYEGRARGLSVTVVLPGVVRTGFFARRGSGYDRAFPRPITAGQVADAVLAGIERRAAEIVVPGWLTIPMRIQGAFPGLYRALAGRFG